MSKFTDKALEVQTLLDSTAEFLGQLVFENLELSAVELLQLAVSQVIIQYQADTQLKKFNSPVGRVDTKSVAFQLHDQETVAILRGRHDFAEDLEFDSIGGEEDAD